MSKGVIAAGALAVGLLVSGSAGAHARPHVTSVQTVTAEAAEHMAAPAALLARMEGLEAHARAADARLQTPLPGREGLGVGASEASILRQQRQPGIEPDRRSSTPFPSLEGRGG